MKKRLKVLLAENDYRCGIYIEDFLDRGGFEVTRVENPQRLIEYLKTASYDVYILDITMADSSKRKGMTRIGDEKNIPQKIRKQKLQMEY